MFVLPYLGYLDDGKVVTTSERVTDSIYWCVATLTSTGYGDIRPLTDWEIGEV